MDPTDEESVSGDYDITIKCDKQYKQLVCIITDKYIYKRRKIFNSNDMKYIHNKTIKKIINIKNNWMKKRLYHIVDDELRKHYMYRFSDKILYESHNIQGLIDVLNKVRFGLSSDDEFYCKKIRRNVKVIIPRYLGYFQIDGFKKKNEPYCYRGRKDLDSSEYSSDNDSDESWNFSDDESSNIRRTSSGDLN